MSYLLALFENNYFYSGEDQSVDIVSWLALVISFFSVLFTYKAIFLAKKTEIKHEKFKYLCLDPISSELDFLSDILVRRKNSVLALVTIQEINDHVAEFTLLITRIRTIYPRIKASEMQNELLDFSDLCFKKTGTVISEDLIGHFKKIKLTVLDMAYKDCVQEMKFFDIFKN